MTEKRFRVQKHCLRSSYGIEAENWLVTNDNHSIVLNDKAEAHMVANMSNDVISELNALHKENTKLKSENEMLRTTISRNEAYIDRLTHKSEWSNHSQKVSVEDIIGLVKTDEPTDSVELKKELYK